MRSRLILTSLALGACSLVFAGHSHAVPDPARIKALFADLDQADRPGCSVGVMHEGALVYAAAFGSANLTTRERLQPDTIHNIGSVSKQFTAFAVLLLEDQRKLALDDPVRKYVPELGAYAEGVTLRHLLHHLGGLRDYIGLLLLDGNPYTQRTTHKQAIEVLARQRAPNSPPGTEYEYSNTGYFLLGLVVERVSGRPLAQFSREQIFRPLGMRDTQIVDRYPTRIPRLARGYVPTANGFEADETRWEQTGDGQVHTSLADFARWERNLATGAIGGARVVQRMFVPGRLITGEQIDYAGGLALGEYRGLRTVRHGGDWAGFRAHFLSIPERGFAAAVLCNRSDAAASRYTAALAELYAPGTLTTTTVAQQVKALRRVDGRANASVLPVGLYRDARTASYLRLVNGGTEMLLEMEGARTGLDQVEPGIFALRDVSEVYAALIPPRDGRSARIVLQDSPRPDTFEQVAEWNPESLGVYEGVYESEETRARLIVTVHGDVLELRVGSTANALQPAAENEFTGRGLPDEDAPFTLHFDAAHRSLRLDAGGLRGLQFVRR